MKIQYNEPKLYPIICRSAYHPIFAKYMKIGEGGERAGTSPPKKKEREEKTKPNDKEMQLNITN